MVTNPDIFKQAAGRLVPAVETLANFKENALLMGIMSGSSESIYRATSAVKFAEIVRKGKKEDKDRRDQQAFIDLLAQLQHDLANIEADLAQDYGKNFAEDILADLHAQGLVEDEEFSRINAIEDPKERRRAIAQFIQSKLKEGSITIDHLPDDPRVKSWLDAHQAHIDAVYNTALDVVDNNRGLEGLEQDVLDEIIKIRLERGESPEYVNDKVIATTEQHSEIAALDTSSNGGFTL